VLKTMRARGDERRSKTKDGRQQWGAGKGGRITLTPSDHWYVGWVFRSNRLPQGTPVFLSLLVSPSLQVLSDRSIDRSLSRFCMRALLFHPLSIRSRSVHVSCLYDGPGLSRLPFLSLFVGQTGGLSCSEMCIACLRACIACSR